MQTNREKKKRKKKKKKKTSIFFLPTGVANRWIVGRCQNYNDDDN
jgi:hypothetical protein